MATAEERPESGSKVERTYGPLLDWVPYVTLAVGWALSLAVSDQPVEHRLVTTGVAAAAVAWTYLGYTRLPSRESSPVRFAVYFFGMVALGAALMHRDGLFFVFVITGFFHANLLRPPPLVFLGIAATSAVVNQGILEDAEMLEIVMYTAVLLVQTLAIGGAHVLGEKVLRLTGQREEALRAKEAALEENAGLHMQLLAQAREAGVLDERQRLAREIHDTVAQGLAGIIAQLNAAEGADEESGRRLESAAALARASLAEARRTVQAIGPPTLDAAQLPEALAEESSRWSEANGVPVAFTVTGEARPMHPEVEVTLLRTVQEALTNVRKHAGAGRVGLTLSYMDDQVALDVRDDGRGFEPGGVTTGAGHGYGLAAMRQRVGRIAGSVSVESSPGAGTVVSANVPAIPQAVAHAP